jgi:hypothetical protein
MRTVRTTMRAITYNHFHRRLCLFSAAPGQSPGIVPWRHFFLLKGIFLMKSVSLAPPSLSIDALDWHAATFLGSGCCGVVYVVAPGIVAKVSPRIAPQEASIQAALAEEGLALPVLGYTQSVWLPPDIRRGVCRLHGMRRSPSDATCTCTCHTPVDVLLMPTVERICTDDELSMPELIILLDRVSQVYWCRTRSSWDCHAGNVALYRGRYVALDFGAIGDTCASRSM